MATTVHLPRMTWVQAKDCALEISRLFEGEMFFIGGSLLRHCPTVGDIDMCLLRSYKTESIFQLLTDRFEGIHLIQGYSQKRIVCTLPGDLKFKLDVWIIDSMAGWGPTCCFVAGDGIWNAMQRRVAASKGYTLGFYLKHGSDIISCETERDVYKILNMPWRDYPARSLMQK